MMRRSISSLLVLAAVALAGCEAAPETLTASAAETEPSRNYVVQSVTIHGPSSANDQNVTYTSTVQPAGTYHYTWLTRRCTVSGSCPSTLTVESQGINVTSFTEFVSRYDIGLTLSLEIRAYAGGPVLATDGHYTLGGREVYTGPGSCAPQLTC